jgi:hypothetical protein
MPTTVLQFSYFDRRISDDKPDFPGKGHLAFHVFDDGFCIRSFISTHLLLSSELTRKMRLQSADVVRKIIF